MNSFSDWLNTALSILAIASLAGYGSTRARLRDLKGQLTESREETAAIRVSRTEDKVLIDTQAADLAALKRIVTNEVHWVQLDHSVGELAAAIQTHNKAATDHWVRELAVWDSVLTELREARR